MSTSQEILAVYEQEIGERTKIVFNKFGKQPFYDGFAGFQIEDLYSGLGIEKIICSEYTPVARRRQKCL